MVFIRATKRPTIKHTNHMQSADARNQKRSHVHVTNKIIKNYNQNKRRQLISRALPSILRYKSNCYKSNCFWEVKSVAACALDKIQ